ncbi:hypothetical protein B0H14DRAFT_306936 [Mycena olivaceomarginata]|nr:hypothetical protein B0H14DRAFT_306936 [Mycena olivaceomarginata]
MDLPSGLRPSRSCMESRWVLNYCLTTPRPLHLRHSFSVYEFPGETADWKNFQIYNSFPNLVVNENSPYRPLARTIYANSMITGPLAGPADVLITNAAWQYAVVNQNAANSLALQAQHPGILCKNVPQGNRVDANLYAQGQAGNAKFNTRLAHLKDPNYSPGNGQFKCSIL